MACTLYVAWDGRLAAYDFGAGHPMAPARVELTIELAQAFGLFAEAGVSVESPVAATDAELELVHDPRYIAEVRLAGEPDPDPSVLDFGLGTDDDPVFPGMHDASALVAGATLAAARAVWTGAAQHGASIAGGLHHAMRGSASGFCVYNDPAIAIAWLLGQGAERVAYVDVDVHHGDGVQAAFYGDPRVLTISLHQHPAALWPGTGLPSETGGPGAPGSAVNVALPTGTGDAGWLRAFHAVVPPLLRAFRPSILVSQHGCDTHWLDPLAGLRLSIDAPAHRGRRDPRPGPPGGGRPLASYRGRRLRPAPGRPQDLGAPAGRGRRASDRPRGAHPGRLARARVPPHRPPCTRVHDRRGPGRIRRLRIRIRPGRSPRPGHHGHQGGRLPRARNDAAALARRLGNWDPKWSFRCARRSG